ncbi:MAG: DNA repair protein RecO [Syntrophobacterales bacterium]|jgi:DNA repair protein RecO (recombination protein O)|nr:DNA repair protein RecO [Syntrophobacterales bacterium]
MALRKDEAIVLFKRAYGESDRIIRLFTFTSGKVTAIAKGAGKSQKRFSNTLEPFNHIRVEYFEKQEKGMVRIENADIVETNNGIEASLKRACTACFFTEFADRLTKEREKNIDLFQALKEILVRVKQREFAYADILHYELRMLEVLGYMPNFRNCVYCGKKVSDEINSRFSNERGGVLCPACARSLPHRTYSEGTIPSLVSVGSTICGSIHGVRDSGMPPEAGKPSDQKRFELEARQLMEGFISFHLAVEFKSYRILKSLL